MSNAKPRLNAQLLNGSFEFPKGLGVGKVAALPEKVLQFGEGNFLRGFVDWMVDHLNQKNLFNGKVVVVQPIEQGMVDKLNEQNGLYTLLLRGVEGGKVVDQKQVITSISRGINLFKDYEAYLKAAENSELRVIVSNTTEAGIATHPEDQCRDTPPKSFPAKLTVFLHHRYETFKGDVAKGLILLPCELIDRNGDNLKKTVLQLAEKWNLGAGFVQWINQANYFCNTLVDRIVTGYPKDEVAELTSKLGYEDQLLDTAEIFHLWVIEGPKKLAQELPFAQAGLNVIWTDDMTPYRSRKVRILNGAHTMMVLAAYLAGKDTVGQCIEDQLISTFMKRGVAEEIIPTLDLPKQELEAFAAAVVERFSNPFVKHYLLSISLNSTSKYKARVLPSVQEYLKRKGKLPELLTFSLAGLIAFYRGTELRDGALIGRREGNEYKIQDDQPVLELFQKLWKECDGSQGGIKTLVEKVLARSEMWGMDLNTLPGFTAAVASDLQAIVSKGVAAAMRDVLK